MNQTLRCLLLTTLASCGASSKAIAPMPATPGIATSEQPSVVPTAAAAPTAAGANTTPQQPDAMDDAQPAVADSTVSLAELCATSSFKMAPPAVAGIPAAVASNSGDGFAAGNAPNKLAGMQDLEALAATKSHRELLTRAQEIPPASRSTRWDNLVATSATVYVQALQKRSNLEEALGSAQMLLDMYPTLRKATAFVQLHQDVAIAGVRACLANTYDGSECLRIARELVADSPSNTVLIRGVADLIFGSTGAKYVAAPFYQALVVGHANDAACNDPNLIEAVTRGFELAPDDETARAARDVAAYWCPTQLQGPLRLAIAAGGTGSNQASNGCAVYRATRARK